MDADLPLIDAIRSGDESAIEKLMQRHQHSLYYFALRYLSNESAARDVVQETFVRAYFKASGFQPRSTVKTWLFTIAINLCRDEGRRRRRSPAFVSFDEPADQGGPRFELTDSQSTADESAAVNEELQQLQAAIDRLPEKLKTPLILCSIEQRSHKEAAELLGTTPKTIELRVYRAKKKLRDLMERNRAAS